MKLLKNERGNVLIFILGLFSVMILMFLLLGSIANVYVTKEKASSNADQASLVAASIVLDNLKIAIENYDNDPRIIELEPVETLAEKVAKRIMQLQGENLAELKAVNAVLKEELGNSILRGYVGSALSNAKSEIAAAVPTNISNNNGILAGTEVILFNNRNRIEVKTSAKFKALKFDEYFDESKRILNQKSESPSFDFVDGYGGYSETLSF